MKRIISYSLALLLMGAVSCDDGYNAPSSEIENIFFGVTDGIDDGAGSPNIDPAYMTTREFAGLGCVSLGYLSHQWEFLKRDKADDPWKPMNDFDMQLIRENSGIPSTEIDDFNPEDFTYEESFKKTDLMSLLFYFDQPGDYCLRLTNTFPRPVDYYWESFDYVYGLVSSVYRYSKPVGDGTHVVQEDFRFHVYKKLEGECRIYLDQAKQQAYEFDFRAEDALTQILEVKAGATLYFDEISGDNPDFDFDYVDTREWKVTGGGALNDGTPNGDGNTAVVSDAYAKEISVTFTQPGAYAVTLSQGYDSADAATNWNGAFTEVASGFTTIPVIIKVVP